MTKRLACLLPWLAAACFTEFEVGGAGTGAAETGHGTAGGTEVPASTEGTVGGADGGSGDTAGACEPIAPGEGPCPARCSGGCALGTCTIACDERTPCGDTDIVCPQGWPCVVLCDDQDACNEATVHCADGSCELQCSVPDSCHGLEMMCGEGSCNAWCGGDEAGVDRIDCGASCDCRTNCSSGETATDEGGSSD